MKIKTLTQSLVTVRKLLFGLAVTAALAGGSLCHAVLVNQWSASTYTSSLNWTDSVSSVELAVNGSPQAVANVFGTGTGVTVNGGYFTMPPNTGPAGMSNFTVAIVFKPTGQTPTTNSQSGWSTDYWASVPLLAFDIGGGGQADWGISYGGNTGYKCVTAVGAQSPSADQQARTANLDVNAGHAIVLQVNASSGQIITCLDGAGVATNTVTTITNRSTTSTAYVGGGAFVNPNRLPGYYSVIQIYNDATNDPVALSQSLLNTYGGPAPITLTSGQGADPGQNVKVTVGVPTSATQSGSCTVTLTSDNLSVVGSTSVVLPQGVTSTNLNLTVLALGVANLKATAANLASATIAIYGLDESGLSAKWLASSYVSGSAWVDSISSISAATQTGTELSVASAFGSGQPGVLGNGGGFDIPGGTIPAGCSNYTVAVAFKPTANGPANTWFWNSAGIIGYDIGGNGQGDFGFSWGGDGTAGGQRVVMGIGLAPVNTDTYMRSPSGTALALNATHSAVLQVNGDSSNIVFVVDGMRSGPLTGQSIRSLDTTRIIKLIKGLGSAAFPGYIAEVRIYTNAAVNAVGLSGMLQNQYAAPPPITLAAVAPAFVDPGNTVTLTVGVPASATVSGSCTVTLTSGNTGVVGSTSVVLPTGVTSTNITFTILNPGVAILTATASGLAPATASIGGLIPRTVVNVFRASSVANINGGGVNDGDPVSTWAGDSNVTQVAQWNLVGANPTFAAQATPANTPAISFTGNSTLVIDSTGDPTLNPVAGLTNFSCAIVFKTSAAGAGSSGSPFWQQTGIVNNETVGVVDDWGVTVDGVGQISFGVGNPDVTISQIGYGTVSPIFHVAVVAFDALNGKMRLLVDDQPLTTSTNSTSANTRANYKIRFGDPNFVGQIAEVRFFNGALTPSEATNLVASLQSTYSLVPPSQSLCSISAATGGDDVGGNVTCTVTIPPSVNAFASATVTVTSSNAAAVTVGGGSTLTLTFPAGATNVQSFPAHMLAAGTSVLTASSAGLVSTTVSLEALAPRTLVEVFRAVSLTSQIISLTNGGQVTSWAGDSNVTCVANAPDITNAPTFRAVATAAGTPAVLFDPGQFQKLLLSGANSPVGGLKYFSVLLVFKVNDSGITGGSQWFSQTGILDAEEGGTHNDWGIALNGSGNLSFGIGNGDYTMTATNVNLVNTNLFHVAVLAWDPTRQQLRINIDDHPATVSPLGTAISANPRDPSLLQPSGGDIMWGSAMNHDYFFAGELAEVRFYNGALYGSEVTSNLVSVASQYGISLPNLTVSTNAHLTALTLSPVVSFTPAFDGNTLTGYTATVPFGTFTVTATDAAATATNVLFFNGNNLGNLASGVASGALTPTLGITNVVRVLVTAQDGVTTNAYVVNVIEQPSQAKPLLTNSVSGSTLSLAWSADHLGYRLLVQTNNLDKGVSGNSSDWAAVPGSHLVTATNITITKTNRNEYYRLVYP